MAARWRRAAALAALLALAGALAAAWAVPLPARLVVPGSPVVAWADGTAANVGLAPDERWRIPADLDRIDRHYLDALVAFEDARFRWHPGVDPVAVVRAAAQNLAAGRVVSGASTITMQLVRVLEPRPRTLASKAVEALRALQLELRLSKEEILAAYLSFAPFGRNVEGVEAAAWTCFGHDASALSPAEIATLLAVPQDPNARYPHPDHASALQAARDGVARRLALVHALPLGDPPRDAAEVLGELYLQPVPRSMRPVPREVPHAAAWMRRQEPAPRRLVTTLDRGVQALTERALTAARAQAALQGIHNASVVVIEHQTARVVALVGGFDFWDEEHGGQIIGFDVPRSPGSTLKPFLYARAIDEGRLLPEYLVADVPTRYGTYAPANYDGEYAGMVTMEQALSRSLNVPFVNLLAELGVERFLGLLRSAGVRSLSHEPGYYGLSLVAGGVELTPFELAGLYVALAHDGVARPLRWRAGEGESEGVSVFAPGAAWLTRRALRLRDRPDFPARRELSAMPRDLHWKTGTSFGNRDAWAAGSGRRYTVVVWMGNLDNRGSAHLVGAQAAGPVLFDILEGLDDGLRDSTETSSPPPDLELVSVCALSGHLPGAACPHTVGASALRRHVPTGRCPLHVQVEVDVDSGERVGPGCREGRRTRLESYVVWPARVRRWLGESLREQATPPAPAPSCELPGGEPPRIVSPGSGTVAVLIPGLAPDAQEIAFEAEASAGELSWFVDGVLLGRAEAHERVWWTPQPGAHEVLVMDGEGRADRTVITVKTAS